MTEPNPFITYLEGLRENRGALAALRRGLGQTPGTVPAMYPYVVRWLPQEAKAWQERTYYIIASLFAYHPQAGGTGNVGSHFARARDPGKDDTAIERRFTALLAAHPEDLDTVLRQAIGFLKSKEVPVNWQQLVRDLQGWGWESKSVQKRWAASFWGRSPTDSSNTQSAT